MIAEPNITTQYKAQVDFNAKSKDSPRYCKCFSVSLIIFFLQIERIFSFCNDSLIRFAIMRKTIFQLNVSFYYCNKTDSLPISLCFVSIYLLANEQQLHRTFATEEKKCLMEYLRKKVPFI